MHSHRLSLNYRFFNLSTSKKLWNFKKNQMGLERLSFSEYILWKYINLQNYKENGRKNIYQIPWQFSTEVLEFVLPYNAFPKPEIELNFFVTGRLSLVSFLFRTLEYWGLDGRPPPSPPLFPISSVCELAHACY